MASSSSEDGHSMPALPASSTLQIMSDLHLETPKFLPMYEEMSIEPNSGYLALLGDIGLVVDNSLFDFLIRQLHKFKIVFYILGNHEPYSTTSEDALAKMQDFEAAILSGRAREIQETGSSSLGRLVFMNRTRFDLSPDVTILGCTLFSQVSEDQKKTVALFVSDFSNIAEWTVDKHNAAHRTELAWLNAEVESISRVDPQRKIIILTHYSPTAAPEANDPDMEDSRGVHSAFVTDLKDELCWSSPLVKLWAFGHTHYNCHFTDTMSGKLVFANQRGYGREDIFDFDSGKTITIE